MHLIRSGRLRRPPCDAFEESYLRASVSLWFDLLVVLDYALGCGTIRMYGLGDFQPFGYVFFASSSDTEPAMMTSSPCFQLTGVATLCFAVNCRESMTRSTSSKLRPVVIGYTRISLIFLSGPMTKTLRTVWLSAAVRPSKVPSRVAGSMPYAFDTFRSVSPIIG